MSSFGFNINIKHFMVPMRFLWVKMTPLGVPVEPEVYMTIAVSEGVGGEDPTSG